VVIQTLQISIAMFLMFAAEVFVSEIETFKFLYGLLIPLFIVYLVIILYFVAINLKWISLLSFIEMKKNQKIIKKVLNLQLWKSKLQYSDIYKCFQKLYFDMKIENIEVIRSGASLDEKNEGEFNNLGIEGLRNMINFQYLRYLKSNPENQNIKEQELLSKTLSISQDMKHFLSSTGNSGFSDAQIEYMLYFSEDQSNINNGEVSIQNLYDIWGSMIHFSREHVDTIIKYIFTRYYEKRKDLGAFNLERKDIVLDSEKIYQLINYYRDYFTKEHATFIKNECQYLPQTFSLNSFISLFYSSINLHPK